MAPEAGAKGLSLPLGEGSYKLRGRIVTVNHWRHMGVLFINREEGAQETGSASLQGETGECMEGPVKPRRI